MLEWNGFYFCQFSFVIKNRENMEWLCICWKLSLTYSSEQLESTGENVKPQHQLKNTVTVDDSVGNDTTFLVTWQTSGPPEVMLFDPNGRKYSMDDFITNLAFRTARLWIPGTAKVGVVSLFIVTTFSQAHDFQINHRTKCIV